MLSIIHLHLQDYTKMPWKNGKGYTFEIAKNNINCTNERFNWRVSMASIDNDGPFSLFNGYRRYLSILNGQGIQLTIDEQNKGELYPFNTLSFSGDSQTQCRLLGDRVKDFNLIYDPSTCHCSFRWINVTTKHTIDSSAETVLLFCTEECHVYINALNNNEQNNNLTQYESLQLNNPLLEQIGLTLMPSSKNTVDCYCCVLEMTVQR